MPPKVKHCPHIAHPPIVANGAVKPASDTKEKLGASTPPPPLIIPTSVVTLKTEPSIPQLITMKSVPSASSSFCPPPTKKLTPPGPYVKGQVGHIFFSLGRIRSYTDIPPGHSLIISSSGSPSRSREQLENTS